MSESARLFSDAALDVLNRMVFDGGASYFYDHLSGGFIWSDEFPACGSQEWSVVGRGCLYRWLIHERARITLGEDEFQQHSLWQQVKSSAGKWPGLREERRSERVRKRLLAAKRAAARCYETLFDDHEERK